MTSETEDGWSLQLSQKLCKLPMGRISPQAMEAARLRLLHAVGVSLAHSDLPAATTAWKALGFSRGESFAFGRSLRLGAEDAAFINATIGHGSLLEDCGPGGLREGSHPGTFVIPAALAVAEELDADGAALLAAMVVGYEAVSRIGFAGPPEIVQRRFRPLGVMGAFGSAAASATLMGAGPEQMAAALAIAANLAGGTTQGIFEGTMDAYFEAAFAARNGIVAARLAMAGAACPRAALEGEFGFFQTYGGAAGKLGEMLADRPGLGIETVGTKRFAACLQNQQTLALIADGLKQPLKVEDIARVTITRPAVGTNGLNSPGVSRSAPFANMLSAQMSARFTAASALLGHPVDDPGFFDRHHADTAIVELTRRIDLVPMDEGPVSVQIFLTDGSEIVLDDDKSAVLFPNLADVARRFVLRAGMRVGQQAGADVRDIILSLDCGKKVRAMTCTIAAYLDTARRGAA
ncbi:MULTISPECIES: MmgE/PrpD family protein [unclassified Mesorhizobium]|uniref:MmgE/PrpD family protein n=1 Tax=unclassified Mesorhizobium TaxID=325217 RepID=UPI003014C8BF